MGKLILLTTPLGNPGDISSRALKVIEENNQFACEDTRTFQKLLNFLNIDYSEKKFHSFHDHSEGRKVEQILRLVKKTDVVLVSEAGSPVISDPAYPLIKRCVEDGVELDTIPGASSLITSVELSGLPANPIHYYGFFPRDKSKQKEVIEEWKGLGGTFVVFEAPQRIKKTLNQICEIFPHGQFALTREMTKMFQSVYRFSGEQWVNDQVEIMEKGEMVLVFYLKKTDVKKSSMVLDKIAQEILEKGAKPKLVAKLIGEVLDENPKDIYQKLGQNK